MNFIQPPPSSCPRPNRLPALRQQPSLLARLPFTIRSIRGQNPLTALAVYDSDPAGDLARSYLSQYSRVQLIALTAHDLTDYWRSGGNLLTWLTSRFRSVKSVVEIR